MAATKLALVKSMAKDEAPSEAAVREAAVAPQDGNGAAVLPEAADNDGAAAAVAMLAAHERREKLRIVEALLFAAAQPLAEADLALRLPPGEDVASLLAELQGHYAGRGVSLVAVAGRWAFRTAADLGYLLENHTVEERRLSKAALETLAIIAYHQPVTRAEIEEIRGVSTSKGSIDVLLETRWIRPRGRRRAPGRPVTYGTTDAFLDHFGLAAIKDLPGLAELKGAGLLDGNLPPGFTVPEPTDTAALMPDELPLELAEAAQGDLELDASEPAVEGVGDDGDEAADKEDA